MNVRWKRKVETTFNNAFMKLLAKSAGPLSPGCWPSVHRHVVYSAARAMSTARDVIGVAKVETVRTTFIKPMRSIGRKECELTSFDLKYLAVDYAQWLFTYRSCSKIEDVEEKLKDGLRVVLEGFYPLAGKMGKDEDRILKVEYDDEMNGVKLKTAVAKDTRVADMVEGEGTTFEEFIPYVGVPNYEGLYRSLLAVQVTKLKDGFALGCAFNHAVGDGISMWNFLKVWADTCNDPTYVPLTPFHDRNKARNTRVKVDLPLNPKFTTTTEATLSQKLFSFTESTIDNIKSNTCALTPFSTFQCMAAHVWRAVTCARQLAPEETTMLGVVANIRNKIDPPVPETYFGNLIQLAITKTTAGVLYCNPPATSATLIQRAIKMLDSKTIGARQTEWEKNPLLRDRANCGANIVIFGSSPRFKVYELDFGWGMPEIVKSGHGYVHDGMVFMHQGKHGGRSIDVSICLENKVMKRLEMDKDFLAR